MKFITHKKNGMAFALAYPKSKKGHKTVKSLRVNSKFVLGLYIMMPIKPSKILNF